jgi:hypothetical protein
MRGGGDRKNVENELDGWQNEWMTLVKMTTASIENSWNAESRWLKE